MFTRLPESEATEPPEALALLEAALAMSTARNETALERVVAAWGFWPSPQLTRLVDNATRHLLPAPGEPIDLLSS